MWPAPSHSSRLEPGIRLCSLRLCPMEVILSSVPQMIDRGHPAEGFEVIEVVEGREGGVEVRDDGERRRVEHRVDELHHRGRYVAVAERVAVGEHVGDGVAPRARDVDDPVTAVEGAHGATDEAAAEAERQHREQDPAGVQAAGRGRHEGGADDRVAEQLGVVLGQGDDAHPAHRVADDDAASGDRVLDDAAQVVAELLDRAVLLVGAGRPAVAALVVEDRAHLAAVGGALEVPAVEVERVAVDEDDGQVVVGGGHAAEVLRLVDLDVEVDARRRRRPRAARLWSAPNATSSPAARLPMTRFWRAMPTAPAAAARPAAPTTVPKMRPLMLNGWSFRSPRCRLGVRLGVDVPADQPAADAGDDLVADRVARRPPSPGRWARRGRRGRRGRPRSRRRQLAVQVDDELVHAHAAADRPLGVADPDVGACCRRARGTPSP